MSKLKILADELLELLMDEDLDAEKLLQASEGLLPQLSDELQRLMAENPDLIESGAKQHEA